MRDMADEDMGRGSRAGSVHLAGGARDKLLMSRLMSQISGLARALVESALLLCWLQSYFIDYISVLAPRAKAAKITTPFQARQRVENGGITETISGLLIHDSSQTFSRLAASPALLRTGRESGLPPKDRMYTRPQRQFEESMMVLGSPFVIAVKIKTF